MPETRSNRATFCKAERLCSKKRIEQLFGAGNRSLSAYPMRAVYGELERDGLPVELLLSVSKRHFKNAVDRNRVKRLMREAYRKNKYLLWDALQQRHLSMAILWTSKEMKTYAEVETKMKNLLQRISESL